MGVEEAPLAEAVSVLSEEEPLLVAEGLLPEDEAPALPASVASEVVKVPHSLSRACSHWNCAAASEPVAAIH